MTTIVNDFTLNIATANGTGSQSANLILLQSLFNMGIEVSGKNLFPSKPAEEFSKPSKTTLESPAVRTYTQREHGWTARTKSKCRISFGVREPIRPSDVSVLETWAEIAQRLVSPHSWLQLRASNAKGTRFCK